MKKNILIILAVIILTNQISAFEFCSNENQDGTNIRLISVNDMLKENLGEWIWQPFQKIELETRVENQNDESGTYIVEAIFKDENKTIKLTEDSSNLRQEFSLSSNERKSVSLKFKINGEIKTGNYKLYIKFYKKNNENKECVENSEKKIKIKKIKICKNKKVDENKLELVGIKENVENNENKWIWEPRNNIKITLNLENKNYSKKNFITELIFLDKDNKEISLVDNSSNTIKETTLSKDSSKKINFYFKLKSDIKEGKYTLYAKTYDTNNKNICTSLKAEDKHSPTTIEIKKAKRKVIVTKIKGPENIKPSSQEQYTATITNIGRENEDKALVIIYNYQLGIKEKIEILNLKSGETKEVTFNISIPKNASISRYSLLFSTEYEYNKKQDYFKSSSNETDDIKYYITIDKKETQVKTIIQKSQKNNTKIQASTITGNAVGIPNESPNWIITTILIILTILGIVLFFKKPKKLKKIKIEPPQVIRKYKAKLD